MTDSSLLSDLLAWSAQAACIATVGGLLPTLLRLDAPGVRYAYFRMLLLVCLALPWLQARQPTPGAATETFTTVLIGVAAPAEAGTTTAGFSWPAAFLAIVAMGICARAVWIGIGVIRLARLRTAGRLMPCQGDDLELQRMLGTRAEIRYVAGIRQPVTFGLRRPGVLLPDSIRTCAIHVQRAVLSHELIHVQRRDWTWLVAEEIVRAVFWFHPAVWWLISRVQLVREEVVDELAMLAIGTRRGYIEALAAFADDTPLVPAAAFARRRHLFRRMRLISREADMSSRRIAWSCAFMAVVLTAGSWYVVGAFPLREAGQDVRNEIGPLEKQARPITPENPVPRRTYSVDPIYPAEAAAIDAHAMVTLMITLDQFGRVAEIRRLGVAPLAGATANSAAIDPRALRGAFDALVTSAADAVRQWTYDSPAEAPLSIRVSLAFAPDAKPRLVAHDGWSLASPGQLIGLRAPGGRGSASQFGAPPPPPPPPPPPSSEQGTSTPPWAGDAAAMRVGGNIRAPTKTKHVNPAYPASAQDAGVQGIVIIETLIGANGKVINARVVRSIPALDQASLDAVMQWEFTPTRLNGEPVPVLMTVTVRFTLT